LTSSPPQPSGSPEQLSRLRLSRPAQLAVLVAAFALPTLVVKAFGTGWGTAATVGQIAFLATTLIIMLRAA
jgi:hypothetical protein